MGWFSRFFGSMFTPFVQVSVGHKTPSRPVDPRAMAKVDRDRLRLEGKTLFVARPRLGLVNLQGEPGRALMEADAAAWRSSFHSVETSDFAPVSCDVLAVYASIDTAGDIDERGPRLRDLVANSGALVVIMATPNPIQRITAVDRIKLQSVPRNVVWTLNRNGPRFAEFFAKIFAGMAAGRSMMTVWVSLAPQSPTPGPAHDNLPGTIFDAGCGNLAFDTTRRAAA